MKLSPMMQHYIDTKKVYEDAILFYRLGDFYEMFFDDAITVSRELGLTLTGKKCGLEERAPMCGVPHHSSDTYIAKLVEKGYKVAVCEQMEDPKEVKGMVKREVVRIETPGTITLDKALIDRENNYLALVFVKKDKVSISYCDLSTGELYISYEEIHGNLREKKENILRIVVDELIKISPKEAVFNEGAKEYLNFDILKQSINFHIDFLRDKDFSYKGGKEEIVYRWGDSSIEDFSLIEDDILIENLSGLFSYLEKNKQGSLSQVTECKVYSLRENMSLDRATLRNLEIMETLYDRSLKGSLLGVLDKTKTAMGSRTLKRWLKSPLNNEKEVKERLDAVEEFTLNPLFLDTLRNHLKEVYDFQRLGSKIARERANGRDILALKSSLAILPHLKNILSNFVSPLIREIEEDIFDPKYILELVEESISLDAPLTIREGNLIKKGYSKELDDLNDSIKDAKKWIKELDIREREKTGIKNLKVGFNKVFGYYIEVPRSAAEIVPKNYIRKQTLVNNERYITMELKEMESLVLNAQEKIKKLEYELFVGIRKEIGKYIKELQLTSKSIGKLDVLSNFAYISLQNSYIKPIIDNSSNIDIREGRHPAVEKEILDGGYIGNDTKMDTDENSLLVITGPNMSGKSTYMRQVAIIVIMAQVGSFVPADYAKIGIVDRVFTRIGASDNLSQGQSTFFVEMTELAYITNLATEKSLIILDEIGRGTSTYDGLAIAWATAEYLCNEKFKARTLFATHYHQLTSLEGTRNGVKNLNVKVIEDNKEIVFLHKIIYGKAGRSYGVHVAKLAGIPREILKNASQKLKVFEENADIENKKIIGIEEMAKGEDIVISSKISEISELSELADQRELYKGNTVSLIEEIKNLDIGNLTMKKALDLIVELKENLDD